jgi:hypothetical protein
MRGGLHQMAHSIKSPTKGSCEHGNEISGFAEAALEKLSTSEGRTYYLELVSNKDTVR